VKIESRPGDSLLLLASGSPRRRKLLKRLNIPFIAEASGVSEACRQRRPQRLVIELALRKARAVAQKRKAGRILGADTVVALKGKILGKPRDARDAYRMLYRLSGSVHRVFTGVAVVDAASGRALSGYAVSSVRMKKIALDEILRLSRKHLDKAGAYAIQEKRDPVARVVKGSYDNVVGLPLDLVKKLLKKLAAR